MPGTNQGTIIGRIVSSRGTAIPQDTVSDLYHIKSTLARHVGRGLGSSSGVQTLPIYQNYSTRVSRIRGSMLEDGIFVIGFLWDSHDVGVLDPGGIPYQAQILVPTRRNSTGTPLSYQTHQLRGRRLKPAVSLGAISRGFPSVGIPQSKIQSVMGRLTQILETSGRRVPNVPTSRTPSPELYVLFDVLSIRIS